MSRTARKPVDPRAAIGYVRCSTDRQDLSPDAQRAALTRWCAAQGVRLVAVHEDRGVSGAAPVEDRPGLLLALDALRTERAGVLLVAKRDRLARDVVAAAMIERLAEREGATVTAADGAGNGVGPEAALMRGLLDLFAQHERLVIRARTRAALAVKRTRGERTGQVPYGYRLAANGTHVEADAPEQAVVAAVRQLRAEGLTLRAIAARLEAEGTKPRAGGRWHPSTLARIAAGGAIAA